jgi:hypothetical protein
VEEGHRFLSGGRAAEVNRVLVELRAGGVRGFVYAAPDPWPPASRPNFFV